MSRAFLKGRYEMARTTKEKYDYFVQVFTNEGETAYITSIDYSSKTFEYESGKEAMKFSKEQAEDIIFGMLCNFTVGAIITVYKGCLKLKND